MRMSARDAEFFGNLAWEAVVTLTSSPTAMQETMAQSPADFQCYATTYLIETFMTGRVRPLGVSPDTTKGHSGEEQTGEYRFEKIEVLQNATYSQAMQAMDEHGVLPALKLKFKQLHSKGATPYESFTSVMKEWDQFCIFQSDLPVTLVNGQAEIDDEAAKAILSAAPAVVQDAYAEFRAKKLSPSLALERALKGWKGAA